MLSATALLLSSFALTEKPSAGVSEDLDTVIERKMLNTIEYVEDCEELDLGFDPYFYLPSNFNAYEGMKLELRDIEYIEVEEDLL